MDSLLRLLIVGYLALFCPQLMATDSSGITPPSMTPGSIVLLEHGFIEWPQTPGSLSQGFSTTKRCPINFKPYITLEFTRQWADNRYARQVVDFGVCVNVVYLDPATTSFYDVTYLSVMHYSELTQPLSNVQGVYAPPSPVPASAVSPVYGSASIGGSNDMTLKYYFPQYTPATQYIPNYTAQGGILWSLYCYPPGNNPPTDQSQVGAGTNCLQYQAPF